MQRGDLPRGDIQTPLNGSTLDTPTEQGTS